MALNPFTITLITTIANNLKDKAIRYILNPRSSDDTAAVAGKKQQEIDCYSQGGIPKYQLNPDGSTTFICLPSTNPIDDRPQLPTDIPTVSVPPQTIYSDPIVVYIPQPPTRRLPPPDTPAIPLPPVGSGSMATQPTKTTFITTSIKDGIYGCLLHEPITSSLVKIRVCSQSTYNTNLNDSYNNQVLDFFAAQLAKGRDFLGDDLYDSIAAFVGDKAGDLTEVACKAGITFLTKGKLPGKLKAFPILGCDALSDFISDLISRNLIDASYIRGTVPAGFEIIDCELVEPQKTNLFDNFNIEPSSCSNLTDSYITNISNKIAEKIDLNGVIQLLNNIDAVITQLYDNSLSLINSINTIGSNIITIDTNVDIVNTNVLEIEAIVNNNFTLVTQINTKVEEIKELLKNIDFVIEVLNQINVDTEPLVNIVAEIKNKLDLSITNIISGVLEGIPEFPSFEASAIIEYNHDCDDKTDSKTLSVSSAKNFGAIWDMTQILSEQIRDLNLVVCNKSFSNGGSGGNTDEPNCFPLFPGEEFSEFNVPTQLVLTFGQEYPYQTGSLWHLSIPYPISVDKLDWNTHFEPMVRTLGDVQGRAYVEGSRMWVGGYGDTSESITEFILNHLIPLCSLPFQKNRDGKIRIRVNTGGNVKRLPDNRIIRCVRAVYANIDKTTTVATEIKCFVPPTR